MVCWCLLSISICFFTWIYSRMSGCPPNIGGKNDDAIPSLPPWKWCQIRRHRTGRRSPRWLGQFFGGDDIFGMMESNLKRLAPHFFRLVITCYNPTYLSCGVRLSWWLQTWNKINKPLFGVVSLTQPIISDEIDVGVIPESPRLAQSSCDPSCLVPWWRFAEVHSSIHPFFIHSSSILHPFFIHSMHSMR